MTALQDAKSQAEAGADIFEQLKNGTDPAEIEDVYIPFQIVTAENVDEYLEEGTDEAETEAEEAEVETEAVTEAAE